MPPLPTEVHIVFYWVAQEALSNVIKHSGASRVNISLRAGPPIMSERADGWQGEVVLSVSDDGRGFNAERVGSERLGLEMMRERVEAVARALHQNLIKPDLPAL